MNHSAGAVRGAAMEEAVAHWNQVGTPARLCDLLKKYDLGVSTTIRTVEDVTISTAFFAEI